MSNNFGINDILNRLKSNLVRDSHSSGSFAFFGKSKERKEFKEDEEDKEPFYNSSEFEKLFKLGENLGLNKKDVQEALELVVKATAHLPKNTDVSAVLLCNNLVKYPYMPHLEEQLSKVPENLLNDLKVKMPELYMAIKTPFEFLCKYPKTVSIEMFKSFSYNDILDFSRLHPEEHKKLSDEVLKENKDDSTKAP